jgi:hypothetical protein
MTPKTFKKPRQRNVAKSVVVSRCANLAIFMFAIVVAQSSPMIGSARSAEPNTQLHYASGGNFLNGPYDPAVAGFNLADVGYVGQLDGLPSSVKGLVYLGMANGVDATFETAVNAYIGNPKLYGFYLVDEPNASASTAANLMAESEYIHVHLPGAVTFMTEQNLGAPLSPWYYYTPANTHLDLFGLDPYPVRTDVPGGYDLGIIPLAVSAAETAGIPQASLIPVYQAFGGGGYPMFVLPAPVQETEILNTWGPLLPHPAFDYAYSWGVQLGDTALVDDPELQAIFLAHNIPASPEPPTWAILFIGFAGLGAVGAIQRSKAKTIIGRTT